MCRSDFLTILLLISPTIAFAASATLPPASSSFAAEEEAGMPFASLVSQIPDAGAAIGILKGLANGDFVRNFAEIIGLRQRPVNGSTMTDMPWPRQATELINMLEKQLMLIFARLQVVLHQAVTRERGRDPRDDYFDDEDSLPRRS